MLETWCSPVRTADNRWFEIISVLIITHNLYMWFFCSTSVLFCSFQDNTHGLHTHTSLQEIQCMDSISSSILYSFTHTDTHTHESGLLSVVFLCNGNYHPAGHRITVQSLLLHSRTKVKAHYKAASTEAHCFELVASIYDLNK